jgi:hypothetical protein
LCVSTSPRTLLRPALSGVIRRLQVTSPTPVEAPSCMSNDESSPLKRALMSICPVLPSMPTSLSDNSRPPIPAASSSTASAEDLSRGTFRSKRVCRMSGSPRTEASAMSHVPSPICMLLTLAVKSATTPATSTLTLLKSVCQPRSLGAK